jgi:hypothetical protein
LKNNAVHFLLRKIKKSLSTPSTSIKPGRTTKTENAEKVLMRFWRFGYKERFHTQIPSTS